MKVSLLRLFLHPSSFFYLPFPFCHGKNFIKLSTKGRPKLSDPGIRSWSLLFYRLSNWNMANHSHHESQRCSFLHWDRTFGADSKVSLLPFLNEWLYSLPFLVARHMFGFLSSARRPQKKFLTKSIMASLKLCPGSKKVTFSFFLSFFWFLLSSFLANLLSHRTPSVCFWMGCHLDRRWPSFNWSFSHGRRESNCDRAAIFCGSDCRPASIQLQDYWAKHTHTSFACCHLSLLFCLWLSLYPNSSLVLSRGKGRDSITFVWRS